MSKSRYMNNSSSIKMIIIIMVKLKWNNNNFCQQLVQLLKEYKHKLYNKTKILIKSKIPIKLIQKRNNHYLLKGLLLKSSNRNLNQIKANLHQLMNKNKVLLMLSQSYLKLISHLKIPQSIQIKM